jgi:rubrerythrin
MNENNKELLDALMRGMEIEKETFDFYTSAEQKTFDPGGKKMFRWLARTEEEHYLKLNELYTSLHAGGRWVFYGGSTISIEPGEEEVTFDTDGIAALKIAIDIEKKGIDYFTEILARTTDAEGRDMLEKLLDEEREHLRVVTEKYRGMTGES